MRAIRSLLTSALLVTPALAGDKEQTTLEMVTIAQQMRALKTDPSQAAVLLRLEKRYRFLSEQLGGDDPAQVLDSASAGSGPGTIELVAGFPPGCSSSTSGFSNPTAVAILDVATVTSTITVGPVGTLLWDVDVTVNITHTFAGDLDITLTSPGGTIVKMTTDNGGGNDDVFNGTLFDDQAPITVTDNVYVNLVPAPTLSPESSLDVFRGADPNGVWTLSITDDAGADTGTLNGWSLNVTTLAAAPVTSATSGTNSTVTPIVDLATTATTITISGATGVITDVDITTLITHTFAGDLDITLASPGGTVVTVTTDNGGGNNDVFNGTVWDDQANLPCTDHVYVNLTTATPLTPEGHFSRFLGENPNGIWTLSVTDDAAADVGSLNSWTLDIDSGDCGPGSPMVGECFPGTGGVINCPCPSQAPANPSGGCANHGLGSTTGAVLSATGVADVSDDLVSPSLFLVTSNHRAPASGVLNVFFSFKPGGATPTTGIVSGAGVRCIGSGGNLKRLYTVQVFGGTATKPSGADPSITQVSASFPANQHTIVPPETRHYFNVYRDGQASLPANCNQPLTTTNLTNMGAVAWVP